MFNDYKMGQIISNIKGLPRNTNRDYMLITNPGNNLSLIRLKGDQIYLATESNQNTFVPIPRANIEKVFNELIRNKQLTKNDVGLGLGVEGFEYLMAVLDLLPNVQYDRKKDMLLYRG